MATNVENVNIRRIMGQIIPVESSHEYRWEISNFLFECYKPVGEKITSPSFSIEANDSLWTLELYPNGYNYSNSGYLVLLLSTNDESNANVRFKFCILDTNKRVVHEHQSNEITVSKKIKTGAVLMETLLLQERSTEILTKGKLTILYEINLDRLKPQSNCQHRLKQFDKLENLVNNMKYSDMTFVIDGKKLYGHKNILTSGSPVFAAMLEHKMRESVSNTVAIDDIAFDVFQELLRFVYCGKVNGIDRIADQLFVAADKYELLELKEMCENSLCRNLSVDNVICYLNLADLHHADKLQLAAIDFVVAKAKDVVERPEFNTVLQLNKNIVLEIIRALVARQVVE